MVGIEPDSFFFSETPVLHIEVPFRMKNRMKADALGSEISAFFHPYDWWNLKAAYSYIDLDLDLSGMNTSFLEIDITYRESPEHLLTLQSFLDLSDRLELNAGLRYVGSYEANFILKMNSYTAIDVQVRWKVTQKFDVSVTGRNLNGSHTEYVSNNYFEAPTILDTTVFAKIEYRY